MKTPMYKNYEELPLFLNADTVAKALGIAISSAYLMVYAANAKQGWLTERAIEDMRSMFGNEIFRGEQYRLFEMQTKQRQMVKDRFKQLIEHYEQNGYELPPPVSDLFLQLAEQLKSVKGKKSIRISAERN